jgi:Mg-chelatase subunit ChlD
MPVEAQQQSCAPGGPFQNWIQGTLGTATVIVIAIDNSGSVQQANRLPTEKQCAITMVTAPFFQGRNFAVLSFNSSVTVVLRPTNNTNAIVNAINSIQDTSNNTLMDGAIDAACQFTQPVRPNGALVLETDGIPTASTRPTDPLTAAQQAAANFKANCSILAVIGVDLGGDAQARDFLHNIASPGAFIEVGKSVPTLTEWGLIVLGLLLASSLAWMIRRRFAPRPAGA